MNKSKQGGVFTVEFALASFILFIVSFGAFELCRYIYLVNLTNTAISESARDTKVHWHYGEASNIDYEQRLTKMFDEDEQLWRYLVTGTFKLDVCYYKNYKALVSETDKCEKEKEDSVFAQYTLTYDYQPLMAFTGIGQHQITRKILAVQEQQGWDSL